MAAPGRDPAGTAAAALMAHFVFDDAEHRYALMPGSRHVPSVTQVLEAVGMAPDLAHLPAFYRDRGRAIHEAMALHLTGRLDEDSLDDRIRPFVEHGQRWLELVEADPIAVELRWVHTRLEYGGTLDLLCDSKLGPLLVDWKSTFTDPAYEVQVGGGYAPLVLEAAELGAINAEPEFVAAARMAVVVLKPEIPKPAWVPRHDRSGLSNAAIFEAALTVAQWRRAHRR